MLNKNNDVVTSSDKLERLHSKGPGQGKEEETSK